MTLSLYVADYGRIRETQGCASDRSSVGNSHSPFDHEVIENDAGYDDGREQRRQDARHQRDRKSLDGTHSEGIQNRSDEERRDIRVENGTECLGVAGLDGGLHGLTRFLLLAYSLEDEDVGIYRHTDRQHDTRDSRQRQRRVEGGQDAEDEDDVEQQR